MKSSSLSVTVTEELLLQCANKTLLQTTKSPVALGPLDHIAQSYDGPISVVFMYPQKEPAAEKLIPFERLRLAFSRLLDYYPYLTGRIGIDPKDQKPQIEKLGEGAKLVSAQCNALLETFEAEIGDDEPGSPPRLIVTNLPDGGHALVPPFDTSGAILSVQHTRFTCGGVSIGVCLRHIVCDGAGFFQLVRDLAELYRGFQNTDSSLVLNTSAVNLSCPPHIRSYLSKQSEMTPEEREEGLKFEPAAFQLSPEVEKPMADAVVVDTPIRPPVRGRVLRFSPKELAALKAEANESNNTNSLSTFCALTAHVWQSVTRARVHLSETQGSTSSDVSCQLLTSIDLRSRNQLENLPPRYFPNAVFSPVFSPPTAQLLESPLSVVAALVQGAVKPQEPTEVQKTLQWINAQPDKRRVQLRYNYAQEGVLVTQWSKFDMYGCAEFDNLPALVAQPFSLFDGLVHFMATEDHKKQSSWSSGITSGSIDVGLELSEPVWEILDQDVRFRHFRGNKYARY